MLSLRRMISGRSTTEPPKNKAIKISAKETVCRFWVFFRRASASN